MYRYNSSSPCGCVIVISVINALYSHYKDRDPISPWLWGISIKFQSSLGSNHREQATTFSQQTSPQGVDVRHWCGGPRGWGHNLHGVPPGWGFGGPSACAPLGTLLPLAFLVLFILLLLLGSPTRLAFGGCGVLSFVRSHRFLLFRLNLFRVWGSNVSIHRRDVKMSLYVSIHTTLDR